ILVETLDETKAVSLILEQLEKVLPFDSASVQLLKGDTLEIVSTRHLEPKEMHLGTRYVVSEKEPSYPLLLGKVPYVLVKDVRATFTDLFAVAPYTLIRTWLAVPLRIKRQIIGIITLDGYQPNKFTQRHAELALTYASQVAVALDNARLFSELQVELSARKNLIEELEVKNAELERFTYTVSHDLKSPVITIRGFLGFLEQDALSGNVTRLRGDIQRIADATDKMQTLLNELLELSRIGRLVNPPNLVPFNEIVSEALELVLGRIQKNHVQVHTQDEMEAVYVDRQRMVEAVQNLIDNAAKFVGENPKIEIGQRGRDGNMLLFFIKDNGIGIPHVHHERIFGLFNKLDAISEGTGIGLALVRRIIEVHKGRIWVQSEPGQGSTFFFTLPAGPES
ncbi:MAG TPA: ATP-binding protein, partial [Anaerolineales bacterium]|nr:ATP-binding protein [Anaerolineales bacterium]